MARARELTALIRAGAVDGLSIGFRTVRARVDPASRVRKISDVDLWEISIVTFPLLSGARVRAKGSGAARSPDARTRVDDERLLRRPPRFRFTRAPARRKFDHEPRLFGQKYSPSQPRVPAGNPDGGQWTSGGTGANLNQQSRGLPTAMSQEQRSDLSQLEAIANNPAVRLRIDEAWAASNPNSPRPQEHGFWISRNEVTGGIFTRPFANPGFANTIVPGPVPSDAVAFFHTHPFGAEFRGTPGPSTSDQSFAERLGLPGLIRSHSGMHYFGPSYRPVRLR